MIHEGHLLAVFNSAHRVMKAEDILKKRGLQILLIPAPRDIATDCGLAIRFNDDENGSIMDALSQENLLPVFVCRRISGGKYETVWDNDGNLPST